MNANGGDDVTPTTPFPIFKKNQDALEGRSVDAVWFYEWRRDMTQQLRDIRKDHSEAMRGIDLRLTGIENRLNEGDSTIRKHSLQIRELIDQGSHHEGRIKVLETDHAGRAAIEGRSLRQPSWWIPLILTPVASVIGSAVAVWALTGIAKAASVHP